jgi:uncharacterized membrane protein
MDMLATSAENSSHLPASKDEAQHRADQIKAFGSNLELLELDDVLRLSAEQRENVGRYHAETLSRLAGQFDVDINPTARQMSLGMRLVSFLGALALSAATFFFFRRFWGVFNTTIQVGILTGAPILLLCGVEFAARRERTLYFSSLISLVAFTAFVLDLSMLGRIFSITPSQNAFLAWGAFALILAYGYHLRLMLVAALICLLGYLAAAVGSWSGIYWLSFGERPENFIAAGTLLYASAFIPGDRQKEFASLYRLFGLLVVCLAVLILAHWGTASYLLLPAKQNEQLYQLIGFVFSGLVIRLGIRRSWPGVTNLGSTFFVIFLYTKLFDWWWDWMPKYIFFLILGATALILLTMLKKMRSLIAEVAS